MILAAIWNFIANTVYIPDEKGELTAASPVADLETFTQSAQVPPGDFGAAFVKMILTMAAIVILFIFTFWFLKRIVQQRLQKGVGVQSIQILEKRMISPKTMLYLVEADKKKILIAESHLEIKKLESFDSPNENVDSEESQKE